MNGLHWLDYLIIILSLLVPIWIGYHFSKGQESSSKYFKADGKIPAWAIGLSILATLVSSITFLAYPGEGFSNNWIRLVQGLMVLPVLLVLLWVIVPLYRNVIGLSAYEYFEKRFSYFARLYASLGFIMAHFSKMGTVLYLLGLAITSLTGLDTIATIWVLGILTIALTLYGGMEAIIWLDVMQGILLILGGIISLVIIVYSTEGGLPAIWNYAEQGGRIGFGPYDWSFVNLTFWVMAINGIFYAIQKYGTDQTIVQRYLTAPSNKAAIRASLIGIVLSVLTWSLFIFIGTALFGFYNLNPSANLPQGIRPDAVFSYFISTELPIGVTGFIIAALIAAAISSLDADLNCLSAVLTEDFYGRLKPGVTERQKLVFGKAMVVVCGVLSLITATIFLQIGGEGALGFVFGLYAIFSGGIAGMFLLGLLSERANKQGLAVGIVACVLFTGYAVLTSTTLDNGLLLDLGPLNFTHHEYMLGVYSHFVLFFVGYVASYFFKKPDIDEKLIYFGWLRTQKRAGDGGGLKPTATDQPSLRDFNVNAEIP
jgi:solute:Na+ symporter, SSS family